MANGISGALERFLHSGDQGVINVPVLVKGQLVFPPKLGLDRLLAAADRGPGLPELSARGTPLTFEVEGAQVIREPVFDRSTFQPTGENQFLVFATPSPGELIETAPAALARGLFALPFREVLDYVGALRDVLKENRDLVRRAAEQTNATSLLDDRLVDILFDHLPALLDPEALGETVDRELGSTDVPGRQYLDGWVEVTAESNRGMTDRMADHIFGRPLERRSRPGPRVRAIPTRQLHITAGNSPLIPFLSFLRALATKGAAVIKNPADATAISTLLAIGMGSLDPHHPIARHTSLVYWKGGDRRFEDVLFASNAFDRLVVWGSPETVQSVRARTQHTKSVFLNPRYGMSLIGRQAFPEHVREVAVKASADSLIANQKACTASLVHYVQASESEVIEYCRTLQSALARWDRELPHTLPRATLGQLRMLRRGAFLKGMWFENGTSPQVSSAVVHMPEPFDLSLHPMCRLVVVRRIDRLEEISEFLNSSISTVGVYPEDLLRSVRDDCAAAGVSNVLPLGECERIYPGMPHDGMRILSELVNWTNSSG